MSEPRQPKTRYKTTNWAEYNAALKVRGSLTIWLDKDMQWYAPPVASGAVSKPSHHKPRSQQNHHWHRHQRQHRRYRHTGRHFILRHLLTLRKQKHIGPHGQRGGHDHHGQGQA